MVERGVRLAGGLISLAAAIVIYNAYSIDNQFFTTCVYVLKSPSNISIITAFLVFVMYIGFKLLTTILFGTLRLIEIEVNSLLHLNEYGWLAVSESFLALTIFRDQLDSKFFLTFTGIMIIKSLHWISRDRIDYMEQTTRIPKLFNLRMAITITALSIIDTIGLFSCAASVFHNGPSSAILFGHEFAQMIIYLLTIGTKFVLNLHDIASGNIWEHRSTFLFYFEFIIDMLKLAAYTTFFSVVVAFYGIPLHIIRDLYLTIRSFLMRVQDIIRYRKAIRNMNLRFPEANENELSATDRICIICREEMWSARKLPCGHLFHFRCLRSWLERQQVCPTCRRSILDDTISNDRTVHPVPDAINPDPNNLQEFEPNPANIDEMGTTIKFNENVYPGNHVISNDNSSSSVKIKNSSKRVSIIKIPPDEVASIKIYSNLKLKQTEEFNESDINGLRGVPPSSMCESSIKNTSRIDNDSVEISQLDENDRSFYILRSTSHSMDPIYLEQVDITKSPYSNINESPDVNFDSFRIDNTSSSTEKNNNSPVFGVNINEFKSPIKRKLKDELEILSNLQNEIIVLAEKLKQAENRLDASIKLYEDEIALGERQVVEDDFHT